MAELTLLFAAGLLAGGLNAVAGGGSLITLPVLIFLGLSPVAANATGTFALLPGYLASVWAFRKPLAEAAPLPWLRLGLIAFAGGATGATLLLWGGDRYFQPLIPVLMLLASLLFALGPWLTRGHDSTRFTTEPALTGGGCALLFVTCAYGGYFNGGLGILLLAALQWMGLSSLGAMNGIKNLLSAQLTVVAVLFFAWGEIIVWREAFVVMLAATLGGYFGATLSERVPATPMRWLIILTGLALATVFFLRR